MVVAMVASPRDLPQSCTTRLEVTTMLRRQLVALVHDRLQQLGGGLGDAAREEQVVEHQQVRLDVGAQQRGVLAGAAQRALRELGVGLDVANVEALQPGLVGDGLGDVALAGARLADDQRVGAVGERRRRRDRRADADSARPG